MSDPEFVPTKTFPDLAENEADLPQAEREVRLRLRREGIEIESLPDRARVFAETSIADAETVLADVPEGAERDQIVSTVAGELTALLDRYAMPDDHDEDEELGA